MKKYHIILIVFLGIFLMPNTTMACGGNTKHSCKEEVSSIKTKKMSCCSKEDSKDDKGCNGDCDQSKCSCSFICSITPINLISEFIFHYEIFSFSLIEKNQFSYISPSISDGFQSIWLIPKIS